MKKKLGFALIGLKTEQFATFKENFSEKKGSDLKTELEFKISKELKQLGVFTNFTFEQSKKAFLKIQVSCHFSITEESWKEFCIGSTVVFPKGFMAHLTMLTVGSARGVLHAKTEGTLFSKFLIPTVDVKELVDKDVEFSLPKKPLINE